MEGSHGDPRDAPHATPPPASSSVASTSVSMKRLSEMEIVFVDEPQELRLMMDDLEKQSSAKDWHLSVDLEGINLCRDGEICLAQFCGKGSRTVYLVDFVAMNPLTEEPRLPAMLSDPTVLKLLFDPRNDADALGSLHEVPLRGVLCLQLADAAHRKQRGLRCRFVRGLAPAMEVVPISDNDRHELERIREMGRARFRPDKGGSFEVFKQRPLDEGMRQYCASDVFLFDELKAALFDTLPREWRDKVRRCSYLRAQEWKKPSFKTFGRDKAICPL